MMDSTPVKVVANLEMGLVKMFFSDKAISYSISPEGALALAEGLRKAAFDLQHAPAFVGAKKTGKSPAELQEDEDSEEYMEEVFGEMAHEEKMAHGGD
jgi:hypothetical protein